MKMSPSLQTLDVISSPWQAGQAYVSSGYNKGAWAWSARADPGISKGGGLGRGSGGREPPEKNLSIEFLVSILSFFHTFER